MHQTVTLLIPFGRLWPTDHTLLVLGFHELLGHLHPKERQHGNETTVTRDTVEPLSCRHQ